MIKKIKKIKKIKRIGQIGDRRGSSGSGLSFALMLLFFLAQCVSSFADDQPKVSKISQEKAVKTAIEATQKMRDQDHQSLDEFKISAAEGSGGITPYTGDHPNSPYIKNLRAELKSKTYWMVILSLKKVQPGGPAVVFVDQSDGQILAKYLGK